MASGSALEAREAVERLLAGDRRAAARIMTAVEDRAPFAPDLMKLIYPYTGKAAVIGLTGPGGSGKSTLVNRLIGLYRKRDKKVGVVAVDPSSPFSGGAVLGDRIRFQEHSLDPGVYIRSMASRGCLGGLGRTTNDLVRIMEAMGREVILVETLGAGQDEVEIVNVAQTVLLVTTPGMGDDIQAMKAGIIEIAHLIVLNKSDLDGADSALRFLEATLHDGPAQADGWGVRVVPTVAKAAGKEELAGLEELLQAIEDHQNHLRTKGGLGRTAHKRAERELDLILRDEIEQLVFDGFRDADEKQSYVNQIAAGTRDPYSVVEEVMSLLTAPAKESGQQD